MKSRGDRFFVGPLCKPTKFGVIIHIEWSGGDWACQLNLIPRQRLGCLTLFTGRCRRVSRIVRLSCSGLVVSLAEGWRRDDSGHRARLPGLGLLLVFLVFFATPRIGAGRRSQARGIGFSRISGIIERVGVRFVRLGR